MLSDFEETIRWYEKALEVDSESDLILSYMADVYAIMEDYDNAVNYANQALTINHDNATAYSVKNTIKNKQRPVMEQLKEFIEGNYLYKMIRYSIVTFYGFNSSPLVCCYFIRVVLCIN